MSSDTTTPADELENPTAGDAGPVLTVTPEALELVLEIRSGEDDPEALALRIAVTGVAGAEFAYELGFEELDSLEGEHVRSESGGLVVAVPVESVDRLQGAVLDIPRDPGQGGMVIRNPNRPDPMGALPPGLAEELTGSVAERVEQLLQGHINPSLAAHGGYASLVDVSDDGVVRVLMGGGCQGCSVSAVTLSEGIKRMILEAIPEVVDVVDATDHAAGESPFYS
jgi:Fe/S biogenesis protein NfuA